jgi:plastocyanin
MSPVGPGSKALMAAAAAVAILGTACSSSPAISSTTPPATSQPPASASPSTAGATVQQGAGGALVFTPTTLSVKEGQSLGVTNVGTFPHTFTINGKGIDVVNNPGQSQNVTIDLSPGTYQFICRFHVSQGMKGTLTVTD